MTSEEHQLLRSSVREFAQKSIEPIAAKIERDGLRPETAREMASQGFVGARIPAEHGGTGLDLAGYMIVLEELARVSPSAAVRVLITNSIFLPLVSSSQKGSEILPDIASAKRNVAVAGFGITRGAKPGITMEGGRARGRVDHVLNSGADALVAATGDARDSLLLLKSGFRAVGEHPRLGLRGLGFAPIEVDSADFEMLSEGGARLIQGALDAMDLDVAAVSLGIAAGSLTKAVEYSKVRTTFERPLKDYQPVAFGLSLLKAEEDSVRDFAYKESHSAAERTMARVRAVSLARKATNQALQFHGGYGYFEDFGVEKFYRDAMAFSLLFSGVSDMTRLSEQVFDSKAGMI